MWYTIKASNMEKIDVEITAHCVIKGTLDMAIRTLSKEVEYQTRLTIKPDQISLSFLAPDGKINNNGCAAWMSAASGGVAGMMQYMEAQGFGTKEQNWLKFIIEVIKLADINPKHLHALLKEMLPTGFPSDN